MIRRVSAVVIVLVLNATPLLGQGAGAPTAGRREVDGR